MKEKPIVFYKDIRFWLIIASLIALITMTFGGSVQ